MSIIAKILGTLVALEFLYIMYLETIATTSEKTSKVFGMSQEELARKSVNTLFKNQGVYNGLISVLILLSIYLFASKTALMVLMAYIIFGCAVREHHQQSEDSADAGRTGHSHAGLLSVLSGSL